jgi:hypothetical protein
VDKFNSLASWGLLIAVVVLVDVVVVLSFVVADVEVEALSLLRTVLRRRLVAWLDAKRGVVVPAEAEADAAVCRKDAADTSGIAVVVLAKREGAVTKAADDAA